MSLDVHEEIERALNFGFQCIEAGMAFPPTLACLKQGEPGTRLLLGAGPYEDNEDKDRIFLIMGFTARAWEATDVLLVADAHYVSYKNKPEAPVLPPSQDPEARDCMMVYHFDRTGDITSVIIPYHLSDTGDVVREERLVQTEINPTGAELGGRMVETIGASMLLENNVPTQLLKAADLDFETHLGVLSTQGFIIMHTTSEGTTFRAPGIEGTIAPEVEE